MTDCVGDTWKDKSVKKQGHKNIKKGLSKEANSSVV